MLSGRIFKSERGWIAEIPFMALMVQGDTAKLAIKQLEAALIGMVRDKAFTVNITEMESGCLYVLASDAAKLIGTVIRHFRKKQGLTTREVAQRMGLKSHSTYARYEAGLAEPSVSQMLRIFNAIDPQQKVTLRFGC